MKSVTFKVQGMTCESCVKKITQTLHALPHVHSAQVSLANKTVEIKSTPLMTLADLRSAMSSEPQYSFADPLAEVVEKPKSWFETYRPLITVFAFVLLASLAFQFSLTQFNSVLFMNHLMAGFFIGLSIFKFLDLKAFAESFSSYDPIAERWMIYGYAYPFIELTLGLMYLAGFALPLAHMLTIVILTSSTIGVYKRLQSKSAFQCDCLGTTFNLPLSNVTIAENLMMILMASYSLVVGSFFKPWVLCGEVPELNRNSSELRPRSQ